LLTNPPMQLSNKQSVTS